MTERRQKFKSYIWPILVWFVLSSCVLFFATTSRFTIYFYNDKVTHASVFCSLLLVLGWQAKGWRQLISVSVALFMVGCGIELAQTLTPGRHPSLEDVLANTLGLACGCGVVLLARGQRLSKIINPPALQLATKSARGSRGSMSNRNLY